MGAAPGGWSQVLSKRIGLNGKVVAIDLQEMKAIEGTSFIHKSIIDLNPLDLSFSK